MFCLKVTISLELEHILYNTIMNILWLILRERFISYKSSFNSTWHFFIRIPSLTIVEEWLECSIR